MCMVTDQNAIEVKKDKTIYTIKEVHFDKIFSVYESKQWKLNKVYNEEEHTKIKDTGTRYIEEGFHAISNKKSAVRLIKSLRERYDWGKHIIVLFKAIIPKDTYYVKGVLYSFCDKHDGEDCIVTNSIKLVKQLEV